MTAVRKQFVYFLLTGGFAAGVNFFSRIVLSHWMSFSAAIVVAYLFGMLTAFVLNRVFVFHDAANALHHQIFWFSVVNLVAVVQTLAVSLLLARLMFPRIGFHWHSDTVAHAVGVIVPVLTSFLGHRRFTFRS